MFNHQHSANAANYFLLRSCLSVVLVVMFREFAIGREHFWTMWARLRVGSPALFQVGSKVGSWRLVFANFTGHEYRAVSVVGHLFLRVETFAAHGTREWTIPALGAKMLTFLRMFSDTVIDKQIVRLAGKRTMHHTAVKRLLVLQIFSVASSLVLVRRSRHVPLNYGQNLCLQPAVTNLALVVRLTAVHRAVAGH